MYYSISSAYGVFGQNFPTVVLGQAEKLSYEIVYASSSVIPAIIKHASNMIVTNLLKSDYYFNETGVAGIESGVQSFRSDDYSVNFGSAQSSNSETGNSIISPSIKEMLNVYKHTGQSMI